MIVAGIEIFFGFVIGGFILSAGIICLIALFKRARRPQTPSLFYLIDLVIGIGLLTAGPILCLTGNIVLGAICLLIGIVE